MHLYPKSHDPQIEAKFQQAKNLLSSNFEKAEAMLAELISTFHYGPAGSLLANHLLYDSNASAHTVSPSTITRALQLLDQAAALGDAHAQHRLSLIHHYGLFGFPQDIAKTVLFLTFAADAHHTVALQALGLRWLNGDGVPKNCTHGTALQQIASGIVTRENTEWSNPLFHLAFPRPLPVLSFLAIDSIRQVDIFEPDPETVQLHEMQAMIGQLRSVVTLANTYLHGMRGAKPDIALARKWIEQAANMGHLDSTLALGLMLLGGDGGSRDLDHATEIFLAGIKKGEATGYYGLGLVTMQGFGALRANTTEALRLLEIAATKNHAGARYQIARHHMRTNPPNVLMATAQLTFAASGRHTLASNDLGVILAEGLLTPRDCAAASKHFQHVLHRAHNSVSRMATAQRSFVSSHQIVGPLLELLEIASLGVDMAAFNAAFLMHHHIADSLYTCALVFLNTSPSTTTTTPELSGTRLTNCRTKVFNLVVGMYQQSASPTNAHAWTQLGDVFYEHHRYLPHNIHKHSGCDSTISELCVERALSLYQLAALHKDPQALFNMVWAHGTTFGSGKDSHLAKRYLDMLEALPRASKLGSMVARLVWRAGKMHEDLSAWWHNTNEQTQATIANHRQDAKHTEPIKMATANRKATLKVDRAGVTLSIHALSNLVIVAVSVLLGAVLVFVLWQF
eukprot:c10322_g1_i1.p1 GENE.c10322_g1_i1~~c10322_g1_i1.p1  ORF type:complete len:681 (+),score=181.60 c10322_g1_i1:282-2324(+)